MLKTRENLNIFKMLLSPSNVMSVNRKEEKLTFNRLLPLAIEMPK